MPSAAYLAAQADSAALPVDLVEIDVPGTVGLNTLRFCSRAGRSVWLELGVDALPLLVEVGGVATALTPEKAVTDRGLRNLRMEDEADPETWTNVAVASGGTFWTRFRAAYPDWRGAPVRILRTYAGRGISSISDCGTVFVGILDDLDFGNDARVQLSIRDSLDMKDTSVPATVGDAALLTVGINASATSILPTNRDVFTDSTDWGSPDWVPPGILIDSEKIALQRNASATALVVAENHLANSETFGTGWGSSGVSFEDLSVRGPWGPRNASRVTMPSTMEFDQSSASLSGSAGLTVCFAIWLKSTDPSVATTIRIRVSDPIGGSSAFLDCVLLDYWKRFEVSKAFGGGVTTYNCEVSNPGVDAVFFAAQASLDIGTTRKEYVRTGASAGYAAGRGAWGTTAASHSIGVKIKEVAAYRAQGTEADSAAEGLNPVAIARDLLNRALIPLASFDDSTFGREIAFAQATAFRRVITDPRKVSELLSEVRAQALLDVWSAIDGRCSCRWSWRPPRPDEGLPTISESEDVLENTLEVQGNSESRTTRVFIYWGLKSPGGVPAPGDKPEDFDNIEVVADTTAEGPGGRNAKPSFLFSRWIVDAQTVLTLAGRIVRRFRRGARRVSVGVSSQRAADLATGYPVSISSSRLFEPDPTTGTSVVQTQFLGTVVELREEQSGRDLSLECLEANFGAYRYVGPSGMADYDLQTPYVRATYGSICDSAGFLGTLNDPCHRIV